VKNRAIVKNRGSEVKRRGGRTLLKNRTRKSLPSYDWRRRDRLRGGLNQKALTGEIEGDSGLAFVSGGRKEPWRSSCLRGEQKKLQCKEIGGQKKEKISGLSTVRGKRNRQIRNRKERRYPARKRKKCVQTKKRKGTSPLEEVPPVDLSGGHGMESQIRGKGSGWFHRRTGRGGSKPRRMERGK